MFSHFCPGTLFAKLIWDGWISVVVSRSCLAVEAQSGCVCRLESAVAVPLCAECECVWSGEESAGWRRGGCRETCRVAWCRDPLGPRSSVVSSRLWGEVHGLAVPWPRAAGMALKLFRMRCACFLRVRTWRMVPLLLRAAWARCWSFWSWHGPQLRLS